MSTDPIAYSLAALDKQNGKVSDKQLNSKVFFTQRYLDPAKRLVSQVLDGKKPMRHWFVRSRGSLLKN
ncbi:MAG: hypothetical protein ACLR5I_04480 [Odoribacter splanchnicus]